MGIDRNAITAAVEKLHATPLKVVIVCTGAGSGLQALLAKVPGASRTILDAPFPYSQPALEDFLGFRPDQFASMETVVRMAAKAYRRAFELDIRNGGKGDNVAGLGLTATIATDRPKRGEHRVFVALRHSTGFYIVSALFEKSADGHSKLGRAREDEICDLVALNMILGMAGVEQVSMPREGFTLTVGGFLDSLQARILPVILNPLSATIFWSRPMLFGDALLLEDGSMMQASETLVPDLHVLYDGSFNPWHYGHERIAAEVTRQTGKQVVHVITTWHPDKGERSTAELLARADQFRFLAPVLFVSTGLYVERAKMFPGFGFVVGADVLDKILDQKFYTESVETVLRRFKRYGTCFFVPRREMGGEVLSLQSILKKRAVAKSYYNLFTPLHSKIDVSSSALRSRVELQPN